ncbi:protein EARLY FLOWERING 3 [Diospyros lotus]|uniref:protein EARLY FLOWERING 3 n=1 Tax=Diospyros lotus TaxID=55363 RepID=UPI00224D734A|nr:protein EARLY FLOWERING 3 [Diospyros lotus]
MKRGKDDEKIMVPMFPRLHVNDTEKGGPRAPPRNKMALYEQLSIPSQRFNPGVLPLNPNNATGVVHPASSSQGSGRKMSMFFPLHLTHSTHPAKRPYTGCLDSNTSLTQPEQPNKLDEEDFAVPIFVRSEIGQDHTKRSNSIDGEIISPPSPTYLGPSVNIQNALDKEPRQTSLTDSRMRQEGRCQNEIDLKILMAEGEKAGQDGVCLANNLDRLQSTAASFHHVSRVRTQADESTCGSHSPNRHVRGVENGRSVIIRRNSCSEEPESHNNPANDNGYVEDKTSGSLQTGTVNICDDVSETSVVDCISGLDLCPDDVVGIIGQKHFWKARKAIVNQQRVFAVQVFELHRLVKVQRLIAGSPHLLLDDTAYLGKPLNGSSVNKLPLEYIAKPSPQVAKLKDDSENPNHKTEYSAENAVGKTSVSPGQNVSLPSNYRPPFSGNPPLAPVLADPRSNPCFHPMTGHQWLVPVLSPSEGLIYKPYPGHGFMNEGCGGCGPPGPNPMMGNFINPAYGVPLSHQHYQGIGFPPASAPASHGYFPPYGMPPVISGSAVEQQNNFVGLGLKGQPGQLSGGGANFNARHQSSCNMPTRENGASPNELQCSTASSPGERVRAVRAHSKGPNALPLFPTSPAAVHIPDGTAPQLHETDQPMTTTPTTTRVIRVVPHNARSATESAARIFQSIQEERKQYDSL